MNAIQIEGKEVEEEEAEEEEEEEEVMVSQLDVV